jgi:hypothetical protein
MQFINPIEILELSNADLAEIDSVLIKRAKRKLYAQIDLSDSGMYDYKGLSINKSDCEKAINELSDPKNVKFFFNLIIDKQLNDFLVTGDVNFLITPKPIEIQRQFEYIKFISPFFAEKYDRALLRTFIEANPIKIEIILMFQSLIISEDMGIAFKGLSAEIQNRIREVDDLTTAIKNKNSSFPKKNIKDVIPKVLKLFHVEILNQLPVYFQSQINKIADSINGLGVAIWEEYEISSIPLQLLEHLLKLNIDGVSKPTFLDNYYFIVREENEKLEKERNAPILTSWANYQWELNELSNNIEKGIIKDKQAFIQINSIPIDDLNSLPPFANEIRSSIAQAFRSIAIGIWNKNRDADLSIKILLKAIEINQSASDKNKLNADLIKLRNLKDERAKLGKPIKSAPTLHTINGIGTKIYGDTLYFVFFFIPIIPLARYNCEETLRGYSFYGELKFHLWQKIWLVVFLGGIVLWGGVTYFLNNEPTAYNNQSKKYVQSFDTTTTYSYNTNRDSKDTVIVRGYKNRSSIPLELKYNGNQLKNGESPLDGCFGKGVYSGYPSLTVQNKASSDAIVCLYNMSKNKTIRNEYIKSNTSFTLPNIPQGSYKIRVFYGNDWNPEIMNDCGTKGSFQNDVQYTEFQDEYYFKDTENGYTVATLKLFPVVGGNATSSPIEKKDFFNR